MKKLIAVLVLCLGVASNTHAESPKKKALIIISSARALTLTSPRSTPEIPVGFFLVEIARMLQELGPSYEFTLATPDGRAPVIDLNGLDLNFHVQGILAPLFTATTNLDTTVIGDSIFDGLHRANRERLTPEKMRAQRKKEYLRREFEVDAAAEYLGRLDVTESLPNSSLETIAFAKEVRERLKKVPAKTYASLQSLVERDRDSRDSFKLEDFDFVFIPGGHAPMTDMRDHPYLGEILNRFRENGKLIVAVCHGPIALASARFRVDSDGKEYRAVNFPLRGAKLTTVSSFEEKLMLDIGYVHIPARGEKTALTYFVDDALDEAGYRVRYGSPMVLGLQLQPGAPKVVYDKGHKLLTVNGPQGMDKVVKKLKEILIQERTKE